MGEGGGHTICSKLRDVIYGRSLSLLCVDFFGVKMVIHFFGTHSRKGKRAHLHGTRQMQLQFTERHFHELEITDMLNYIGYLTEKRLMALL